MKNRMFVATLSLINHITKFFGMDKERQRKEENKTQ